MAVLYVPYSLDSGRLTEAQASDHVLQMVQGRLHMHRMRLREFKNNYSTEMCSGSEEGSYLFCGCVPPCTGVPRS